MEKILSSKAQNELEALIRLTNPGISNECLRQAMAKVDFAIAKTLKENGLALSPEAARMLETYNQHSDEHMGRHADAVKSWGKE
jgi:hypothetical protein